MKTNSIISCTLAALVLLASCKKDNGNEPYTPKPDITVTTDQEGSFEWLQLGGNGDAIIDWGDGSGLETVTLPEFSEVVPHTYESGTGTKTITIAGDITRLRIVNGKSVTALNLIDCDALSYLSCFGSSITELDLTNCPALENLGCSDNALLSELDLSGCPALEYLFCYDNAIAKLDLTGLSKLMVVNCFSNALTGIDITGCAELEVLSCSYNKLEVDALTDIFSALPDRTGKPTGTMSCGSSLEGSPNPGWAEISAVVKKLVTDKNWKLS
jgi:Leucine-rich repeat (LRR) protein